MDQTETTRSTAMMQSFWNVQRHLVRAAHQTAQENGLSLPQFHSLMTIAPRGPISQKELAAHTHLPKSTSVSRLKVSSNRAGSFGRRTRQSTGSRFKA